MANQSLISVPPNVDEPVVLQRFLARLVEQLDIVLGNRAGPAAQYVEQQQFTEATQTLIDQLAEARRLLELALETVEEVNQAELEDILERLTAIEQKNSEQDDRLDSLETPPRMKFIAAYVSGSSREHGDVVLDNLWTMHANKDTSDPAAPTFAGNTNWVSELPGTPALNTLTVNQTAWITGNEFTWPEGGKALAYRFYCPDVSGNFDYSLWANINGNLQQLIAPFVPTTVGYQEISLSPLLWLPDTTITLYLVTRAVVQPNTFNSLWDVKNKNGSPSAGEAWFQNNGTQIRVHNEDDNGSNQSVNLSSVQEGGTLEFGGSIWTIEEVDVHSSHVRYTVSPSQGRPSENTYILTFSWGSVAALPFVNTVNHFSAYPGIRGLSGLTLDSLTYNNDYYGVDISIDELVFSDDWDVVSYSGDIA